MIQRKMGSLFIQLVKMGMFGGCVLGLLAGCSSQSRSTIISGTEAPAVQVTQLEPETVAVEEVVAVPIPKETRRDIPVEEPARPAPRRELPAEIFATPKSTVISEGPAPVPADEPIETFKPAVLEPLMQSSSTGIPPISFEPEMPALPRRSDGKGSAALPEVPASVPPIPMAKLPQTSPVEEPPAEKEPIQMAKVMPQEPENFEITEETLEAALSDIFFDYDQFVIREESGALLKANAQLLSTKLAEAKIVVEGHCDERGTQSYNMVLGERRAKAVKHFLQDLGVSGENLQVVSYGKAKPFCSDQTEVCWQENRRAHFVIK